MLQVILSKKTDEEVSVTTTNYRMLCLLSLLYKHIMKVVLSWVSWVLDKIHVAKHDSDGNSDFMNHNI